MKQITYDYGRLLDIHSVIGAFQTAAILGKDDDSEAMVKEFQRTINAEFENYKKNMTENPFVKDIEVKRVRQLFRSYRKMLENSQRHTIPLYLSKYYSQIIEELNAIAADLKDRGVTPMAETDKELSEEELDTVAGGNKVIKNGSVNVWWGGPIDAGSTDAFMGHPTHTDDPPNGR